MQGSPIIVWLHWEAKKYPYETAAFLWAQHLHTLLDTSAYANVPIHLESTGALCDQFMPINSEAQALVQHKAAKGQLWTGSWYARPCEVLASGESLIRNLLLGSAQAEVLGIPTQICLLFPAPFHIMQMPQLLAGFGITVVVAPLEGPYSDSHYTGFNWQSADASSITLLPRPSCSVQELAQILQIKAPDWDFPALLCSAADQPDLLGALISKHQENVQPISIETLAPQITPATTNSIQGELTHTLGIPAFAGHQSTVACQETEQAYNTNDTMPALSGENLYQPYVKPWYSGDAAANSVSYISSWPQLRYAMWDAQVQLERWAEPLAAAAWLVGKSYPEHFLAKAWRLLLLNQMYDGNWGCTNNTTYRQMLVQAERAQQLAEVICHRALSALVQQQAVPANAATEATAQSGGQGGQASQPASLDQDASYLWVANPLGWVRDEIIYTDVLLPAGTQHLQLTAANGHVIPYQLHRADPAAVQALRGGNPQRRFTIAFRTGAIPATGFSRFLVQPAAHKPFFLGESIAAGNTLENKYLRVTVKTNGALRIEDKRTGYVYDNCNVFEDSGDIGSATAFAAPEQDKLITTYAGHAHISIVENGVMAGSIQVQHELELPVEIHPYRDHRSQQRTTCEIVSLITLRQGSARVDIRTQVLNRARDHRLRVLFSPDITPCTCHVSQPFAVVARAAVSTPERQTLPKQEFVDISDANHGLMVVSRGTHEYEVKPTPAGTVALTLFRATGAPDEATSDSQALELLQFSYALIPHANSWEDAIASAWEFCAPLRAFTNQDIGLNLSAVQPDQTSYSLVALAPQPLLLSAIKRSEDGAALIVRSYNPTDRTVAGKLTSCLPIRTANFATLDEAQQAAIELEDAYTVPLTYAPRQIVTLRLEYTLNTPTA